MPDNEEVKKSARRTSAVDTEMDINIISEDGAEQILSEGGHIPVE